ncbi:S41 family peptidase [Streptomyces sp. fd1-xmd]|uniref:S41 family peptidase n=1 Tax=Streptomyces sp. fd1-xmd TaxID=1812480 RepID=UPI0009903722|nr:S41 family peptidase [Streptomyces sp. fd1-xmd]
MNGHPARRLVLLTASAALALGTVSVSSHAFAAPPAAAAPSPQPPAEMSAAAELYLTHVLDLLQDNSMDTKKVDWPEVRRRAFAEAAGAKTTADTYDAIDLAVAAVDNPHTVFLRPAQAAEFNPSPEAEAPDTGVPPPVPRGRLVGQEVGYVSLPTTDRIPGYAKAGAQVVRTLDASRPCGWIVDLRADSGGAIWPKLDVLAPLVGDGRLGAFVDADGNQAAWALDKGRLSVGGKVIPKDLPPSIETGQDGVEDYVTHNAYVLKRPRPPVAVLTGPRTASAGEAALIAFRGRPESRSFGLPTAGLATGNAAYPLHDGALLLITSAADMDRTGRRYVNAPIAPDVRVAFTDRDMRWGADDPVIDEAREWLESRPACRQ